MTLSSRYLAGACNGIVIGFVAAWVAGAEYRYFGRLRLLLMTLGVVAVWAVGYWAGGGWG